MSSGNPVSPKVPMIYLTAVAIALILGIAIVTAKEVLNRKILFRSEIETYTSLPVVAEIPKVKKTQRFLNSSLRSSIVAEQFRQLRAAIGLYGKHANDKRLLVTSSISGEGKTYVSTNLAASIAMSGKKVVLIDLDIRSPKLSSVMGVANEAGVVEFLVGAKKPSEIILETDHPNLCMISAGGEADNAMELMLSGKLNELLTAIQDDFDFIVMDTSPIEPVTDAYVLSEYCDRTLVVVRHGYTPKTMVQLFDESSKVQALKNPVIIFNDVRSRGFLKRTYGYGYGYGYANIYRERNRNDAGKSVEI
jgi:capsular exopolysaccharide synthesis family protein